METGIEKKRGLYENTTTAAFSGAKVQINGLTAKEKTIFLPRCVYFLILEKTNKGTKRGKATRKGFFTLRFSLFP